MTKYCVDVNGKYLGTFIGALPPNAVAEVPTMPNHGADRWNGSAWVADPMRLADEVKEKALRELEAINAASIPLIRAYIAAKADSPQALKDLETAAVAAKAKLK